MMYHRCQWCVCHGSLLMVTFGAFAVAMVSCLLVLALAWSCTRPWAAMVFGVMWGTGAVMLCYASPFLLVMWVILALGGGYWYFKAIPEQYDHDSRPWWYQDVGDLSLVWDDSEWRQSAATAVAEGGTHGGKAQ